MLAAGMENARNSILGSVVHYAPGKELFSEGDVAEDVFKVVSGVVRMCKFMKDGRRLIYAFYARDDIFGFEAGAVYSLSAEAVCDCTIISYRRTRVDTLASHDERLSVLLFSYVLQSVATGRNHWLLLGRRSAIGKIAAFLVERLDCSGNERIVDLEMTRQDIADYLGLTIETVSRTFTQLEREALIEMSSARRVRLINLAKLRDYDS